MNTLKPLGKSNYVSQEEALRDLDNYIGNGSSGEGSDSEENKGDGDGNNTTLEDKTDFWSIDNVRYRNRTCSVGLAKTLLDSGKAKTQDEWAEYSRQAKQQGDFHVGDFPLYYALFSQLHSLRENPNMRSIAEEARAFISKQMFKKWLMTLTRLQYKKKGNDVIVHNYSMQDRYELQGKIVGKDGNITSADTDAQGTLELLTGEKDAAEVNEVYKWMTGKESYLLRVNPKQNTERIAGFYADSDGVDLNCVRYPDYSYSALWVKILCAEGTR